MFVARLFDPEYYRKYTKYTFLVYCPLDITDRGGKLGHCCDVLLTTRYRGRLFQRFLSDFSSDYCPPN